MKRKLEEMEKSLKDLKRNVRKSKGEKVPSAALHGMSDVLSEVDRLMDENLYIRKRSDS